MKCAFALSAVLLILLSHEIRAQSTPAEGQPAYSEFIVLRTDRVVVSTGESTHLNCYIAGVGDAAQISCNSHTFSNGIHLVYQVALVVGSNRVGYIISCGGGLLRRIGCTAMTPGQVLKGTVAGGKMSLIEGKKTKGYRVETSAYIGPIERRSGTSERSASASPGTLSVSQTGAVASNLSASHPETSGDATKGAKVHITSSPSGGEILVDGKFFGNTPSDITLTEGEHVVKIMVAGKEWSRTIQITPGEISLHADLSQQ